MAQFKLYLLNFKYTTLTEAATCSLIPISEFSNIYQEHDGISSFKKELYNDTIEASNIAKNLIDDKINYNTAQLKQDTSFCYTYNESFSSRLNSQRTLSFSMDKNIIRIDRLETNPFINYLFVGTQLLLIDKYDNHHLMTVSKISYEFKSNNTVFKYECQDSFNYQLSRQNAGYEIINDVETKDFLGSQHLDWWVLCKIHSECNIPYTYYQLKEEIQLNIDNKIKVIKQSYDSDRFPELYHTVCFSGSGTANSVLISLGELYGLQLKVYERVILKDTIQIIKYYWFEPIKSFRPTGLRYSPNLDLQSFSLTHDGTSFSSVINIQSNQIGDEIITALPSVPEFFRQWFESSEWQESFFTPGLFKTACTEKTAHYSFYNVLAEGFKADGISADFEVQKYLTRENYLNNKSFYNYGDEETECYLYIPVPLNTTSYQYDFIKFSINQQTHSYFSIDKKYYDEAEGKNAFLPYAFNSKFGHWDLLLVITQLKNIKKGIEQDRLLVIPITSEHSSIPFYLICNTIEYRFEGLYLKFYLGKTEETLGVSFNGDLYVSQYRTPSTEDLEFAEVADQLPWLENKLIDFSYFIDHAIITKNEHQQILQILENDLRKVNAKLLLYSQLYYQAIQNKTKIISDLANKIDMVGAIFQADFISAYQNDGRSRLNSNLSLVFSDLFTNSDEPIHFINYYETLGDYVNKYFSAEQSFLKNMCMFKEYFNAQTSLGLLYEYTFSIPTNQEEDSIVSFSKPNQFTHLTIENQNYPIYKKENNNYLEYNRNNIITLNNCQNGSFYYLGNTIEDKVVITDETPEYFGYSEEQTYYEIQWKATINAAQRNELFMYTDESDVERFHTIWPWNTDDAYYYDYPFEVELLDIKTSINIPVLVRCRKHCIHTQRQQLPDGTTKPIESIKLYDNMVLDKNITEIFQQVGLADIFTNFLYQQLKLKLSSRQLKDVYFTSNKREDMYRSINNKQTGPHWAKNFEDLGLSGEVFKKLPESRNWSEDRIIPENYDEIYKECYPISSLYWFGYKIDADGNVSDKKEYHEVPFVNQENYGNFYRRVSLSTDQYKNFNKTFEWMSKNILPFSKEGNVSTVPTALWHLAGWWNNGEDGFDITGWTYKDLFNLPLDQAFQGYNNSNRFVYVKNATSYGQTKQTNIFNKDYDPTKQWSWFVLTDYDKVVSRNWEYTEAMNILLTYNSLNNRFNADASQNYYYHTYFWRILTPEDSINQEDNIEVLEMSLNSVIENYDKLQYEIIPLKLNNNSEKILYRLNATTYYPLKYYITSLSMNDFDWKLPEDLESSKELNVKTLREVIQSNFNNAAWMEKNGEEDLLLPNGKQFLLKDTERDIVAIFLKKEKHNYTNLTNATWDTVGYKLIGQYNVNNIYDIKTDQRVRVSEIYKNMVAGFYINKTSQDDFKSLMDYIPLDSQGRLNSDLTFYRQVNGLFEPAYTILQLVNRPDFYVKTSNVYNYSSFSEISELKVPYSIYRKNYETQEFVLETEELGNLIFQDFKWILFGPHISESGIPINLSKTIYNFDNYSNGLFWYTYRNSHINILLEKALLIETSLMEYWVQAYRASKNCKFFIPEYWQTSVNNQKNYFSDQILSLVTEPPVETQAISKEQHYIWDVLTPVSGSSYTITKHVSEFETEIVLVLNDGSLLDSAKLTLIESTDEDSKIALVGPSELIASNQKIAYTEYVWNDTDYGSISMTIGEDQKSVIITNLHALNIPWDGDTKLLLETSVLKTFNIPSTQKLTLSSIYVPEVKKHLNHARYQFQHSNLMPTKEEELTTKYQLQLYDTVSLSQLTEQNIAIKQCMEYLNINTDNWKALKLYQDETIYEHVSGGMLWTDALDMLSSHTLQSEHFGGWYDMMIFTLQECNYQNYSPVQYMQAKEEHDLIWKQIYTKYPYLIYEQSYTNSDATNSRQLLQLAQWAFKDQNKPENRYDITTIDVKSLKGYKNQELFIGDAIEVDVLELYDSHDNNIYNALVQYLYITDMEYKLREDGNIKLTVSNIKYQDKIIKQLITLIR